MDEVVHDLSALDGSRDVIGGSGVALDPTHAFLGCPCVERETATSSWSDDEERQQRAPDDSGRAKDRDLHAPALEASSSK